MNEKFDPNKTIRNMKAPHVPEQEGSGKAPEEKFRKARFHDGEEIKIGDIKFRISKTEIKYLINTQLDTTSEDEVVIEATEKDLEGLISGKLIIDKYTQKLIELKPGVTVKLKTFDNTQCRIVENDESGLLLEEIDGTGQKFKIKNRGDVVILFNQDGDLATEEDVRKGNIYNPDVTTN